LEGEGLMYNRVQLEHPEFGEFHMYVGHPGFWRFEGMDEQPVDDAGIYYWDRNY
jgi:hypothetical protein